ncbi:MAG: PEGA domain-containing protein [Terriglobia bacterium]
MSNISRLLNRRLARNAGAIVVALFFASALFVSQAAQESHKPLSKRDVIELLEGEVAPARVAEVARKEGITFQMTSGTEKELLDAGANDDLLKALRQLAPKPPAAEPPATSSSETGSSAPILLIEATPGGAQVYIDDEPKASTSPEGRLRFSQLAPGEHVVRLSLAGYRDYEQKVELKPGQTSTVTTTLESTKSAGLFSQDNAGSTAQSTPPAAPPSSAAAIGLMVAPNKRPGMKGVYISHVNPRSSAYRAGLRAGYAILSVDGQPVTSPADLVSQVSSHHPGDTVEITYTPSPSSEAPVQSVRVQLANRSAATAATISNDATFLVAHDHGLPAGQNACVGWMTVGNGMVHYQGQRAVTQGVLGGPLHSFDISTDEIKEVKRNGVYLSAIGAFHIRLKKGSNNNFYVIDAQGRYQPPDALLTAIGQAMSK